MPNQSPSINIIETESLTLGDGGRFILSRDDRHPPLSSDDVFLIFNSTQNPGRRTLCLLKEDLSDADRPWTLFLVRIDGANAIADELGARHTPLEKLPSHLVPVEGKRRIDVIVSTNSGTGKALLFWQTVLQPLLQIVSEEFGESSTLAVPQDNVLVTESADSVSYFAKGLGHSSEERTVILLSGDGGVVDLINAVGSDPAAGPPPTIALVPLGTGNALFHSMHKPAYARQPALPSLAWSLHTLLQGAAPPLPAFEATFPPDSHIVPPGTDAPGRPVSALRGVVVASYGFHASIVYESDTPEHRVHGAKRFGMVAQDLLQTSHPYDARVTLWVRRDGSASPVAEVVARDTHGYVLTSLVSNLEQTFTISPRSEPLDGVLRTVHFGPLGGERTMEAMKAAYDGGRHVDLTWDDGERVGYDEVEAIEMEIRDEDERWRKVCIDGTIVSVPRGGKVTIQRIPQSPFQILISQEALKR